VLSKRLPIFLKGLPAFLNCLPGFFETVGEVLASSFKCLPGFLGRGLKDLLVLLAGCVAALTF